jgi:hypothetical protein
MRFCRVRRGISCATARYDSPSVTRSLAADFEIPTLVSVLVQVEQHVQIAIVAVLKPLQRPPFSDPDYLPGVGLTSGNGDVSSI